MIIWVVCTLNKFLFIQSNKSTFQKKSKVASGKTPFFLKVSFCNPHSMYLNISL